MPAPRKPSVCPGNLAHAGTLTPTQGGTQLVKTGKAMPFGRLHAANDPNSPSQPAASTASLGQGKIAATYFCFSRGYLGHRSDASRGFLRDLTRQLFPIRSSNSPVHGS